MGDWLRYSLFDKYFKTLGCTTPRCPGGTVPEPATAGVIGLGILCLCLLKGSASV